MTLSDNYETFLFSGRAPVNLTLDILREKGVVDAGSIHGKLPYNSAHTVTVPGAAAAWCDTVQQFGSGKVKHKLLLVSGLANNNNYIIFIFIIFLMA